MSPSARAMQSTAGDSLALWISLVLAGCGAEEQPGSAPEVEPSAEAPPVALAYNFRDATHSSGLDAFRQVNGSPEKEFIIESVGGGVALFDYDGDGDLDAYLTNGGSLQGFEPGSEPADALFQNDGRGHFREVTQGAGLGDTNWTNGVRVTDVNGDGWPDLFLTNFGPNVLMLNQGDGTFRDVSRESGLADASWSTGACFADFDRDGDLDLYVANYIDFDAKQMLADRATMDYQGLVVFRGPRGLPPAADRYYVNDGAGHFQDRSLESGIGVPEMFGFQCVPFDFDGDGWLDVFVANDSTQNFLWRNDGRGAFEEVALRYGVGVSMFGEAQAGMGVALADVDGDLRLDIYVTNFSHDYSTLYRGVEDGFFVDVTHRLKLVEPVKLDIAWGCGFEDFDNDGDLELFAINGHIYPQVDRAQAGLSYRQKNHLFEFDGKVFRQPVDGAGPGFELLELGRGAATGDVDGDGDVDILIGNIDGTPTLLVNEGPTASWIEIQLVGRPPNRDAIGARLVARAGERRHLRLIGAGGSFLSSSSSRVHIGLGGAERLDELEVTWPDGTREVHRDLAAGGVVTITRARD